MPKSKTPKLNDMQLVILRPQRSAKTASRSCPRTCRPHP